MERVARGAGCGVGQQGSHLSSGWLGGCPQLRLETKEEGRVGGGGASCESLLLTLFLHLETAGGACFTSPLGKLKCRFRLAGEILTTRG